MTYTFNPLNPRIGKAKLAGRTLANLQKAFFAIAFMLVAIGGFTTITHQRWGINLFGLALVCLCLRTWLKADIGNLGAAKLGTTSALEKLLPADILTFYKAQMTVPQFWEKLSKTGPAGFMMVRFGLPPDIVTASLANTNLTLDALWDEAAARAQAAGLDELSTAAILAAFFHLCEPLGKLLTASKLELTDLDEGIAWIGRLEAYQRAETPNYGGIARDWAAGFTPNLSHFGQNISHQIELAGKGFGLQERTNQLDALVTGLDSANGSVVLIGEPGIGKTALMYGLADRLLQGKTAGNLAHHQIFSLNASLILSQQQGAGAIEKIVLQLLGEAVQAGNIVLALDEAQLFFGQGTGAVNLSQVLLPVLQGRSLKLVLAVTPGDWQKLKSTNSALTSLLTPIVLIEPSEKDTIRLLADRALTLEGGGLNTTYRALGEAYRLAGRYLQDEAYPGKALKLLEAAFNYPDGPLITATSVQRAVESQMGVKVQSATADESDILLNLEDRIHQRMINQSRAVSVVAAALRRARAGVANPKRPIGSFLFLGPTGVGKTELARSLAATYFGAEKNMIRLDMSEYQQVSDVSRLLASGAENSDGLLSKVRQQPFSVVLFDEIEKAHPNILNLFLQLFDEGNLTDADNKATSFKDAIVIATSNAGADEIRKHIEAGEALESFEEAFTNDLINSGQFKPELINRFDEVVLFRPLNEAELQQVVQLMVNEVNHTLEPQKIIVVLTPAAAQILVQEGYDPRLGARPMRRMVQRRVEDAVAGQILRGQAAAGDTITLDAKDVGGEAKIPAAEPAANTASGETASLPDK